MQQTWEMVVQNGEQFLGKCLDFCFSAFFCLVLFAVFAHFDDDEDGDEGEDEGDDMDLGSFVYLLFFFFH